MDFDDVKFYRTSDRWVTVAMTTMLVSAVFLLILTADNLGTLDRIERDILAIQREQDAALADLPTDSNPDIVAADAACADAIANDASQHLSGALPPFQFTTGLYAVTSKLEADVVQHVIFRVDPVVARRVSRNLGSSFLDHFVTSRHPKWCNGPGPRQITSIYGTNGQFQLILAIINIDTFAATYHEVTGLNIFRPHSIVYHPAHGFLMYDPGTSTTKLYHVDPNTFVATQRPGVLSTFSRPSKGMVFVGDRLFHASRYGLTEVDPATGTTCGNDMYLEHAMRFDNNTIRDPYLRYNDDYKQFENAYNSNNDFDQGTAVAYDPVANVIYLVAYNRQGAQRFQTYDMSKIDGVANSCNDDLEQTARSITVKQANYLHTDHIRSIIYIP